VLVVDLHLLHPLFGFGSFDFHKLLGVEVVWDAAVCLRFGLEKSLGLRLWSPVPDELRSLNWLCLKICCQYYLQPIKYFPHI
jgi:hypothetical protein